MLQKLKYLMSGAVCLTLLLYLVLLAAGRLASGDSPDSGAYLEPVVLQGEYSVDGGAWQPFHGTCGTNLSSVYVRGHFTREIAARELLVLSADNISVTMYLNGEAVFALGQPGSYPPFAVSPGNFIAYYVSPGITTADTVEFRMETDNRKFSGYRFDHLLGTLKAGHAHLLYEEMLDTRGALLLAGFAIIVLGVLVLVLSAAGWRNDREMLRKGLALALFSYVSGVYILTDAAYGYLPLLVKNPVLCTFLDVSPVFLVIPACCLYFYSHLERGKTRAVLSVVITVQCLVAIFAFAMQLAGVFDLHGLQILVYLPGAASVAIGVACLGLEAIRHKNRGARFALFSFIPFCIAGILETINGYVPIIPRRTAMWLGLFATILLQAYLLIFVARRKREAAERQRRLESELADARIAVMLSQIQPHFLYNTLTAICGLCDENPKEAKKVTIDFAHYLRHNLDSLGRAAPVPFESELKHIKVYLNIEKHRFEEALHVVYDTPVTNFMVPALSVQPLIENAVKHGVGRAARGGTVKLETREREDCYEVIITDDGVGFCQSEQPWDNRRHIGIENARTRLWSMCRATIDIKSEVGTGTTAVIRLPRERDM